MKYKFRTMLAAFVVNLLAAASVNAQVAQAALGIWADENGESNIEILPCGNYLCGRVVWLKNPTYEDGTPRTDRNNPDQALRSRPILGMTIIKGLAPDEDNDRLKGKVYNARDGRVYDFYLKPQGTTMEVEGCAFVIMCSGQTWTRVQ